MFLTRFILLPSNPPALSKSSSLVEGEKEGSGEGEGGGRGGGGEGGRWEGRRSHEFIGLRPLEDNVRSFIPSNVLLHVCQVIGLKHMYTK